MVTPDSSLKRGITQPPKDDAEQDRLFSVAEREAKYVYDLNSHLTHRAKLARLKAKYETPE